MDPTEPLSKRMKMDAINMKTGGTYIPPAKLCMMQEQINDKAGEVFQRIAWEALKKSIVRKTNMVNSSNIKEMVPELFKENIIRGRGVLTRSILQLQAVLPTFTHVYAALVAVINTKFPKIGELMLKRLIIQYKYGFCRNDKTNCMTAARFIAHLLNQEVAHEALILAMVTHLLENPSNDSIEVAIATLKECGKKLTELTPKGMRDITQRMKDVLHEGSVDVRVHYMIKFYFAIQKEGFKDFEVIPPELDLVEEDDKCAHLINLNDAFDKDKLDDLNVFKFDPDYEENEEKYKAVFNGDPRTSQPASPISLNTPQPASAESDTTQDECGPQKRKAKVPNVATSTPLVMDNPGSRITEQIANPKSSIAKQIADRKSHIAKLKADFKSHIAKQKAEFESFIAIQQADLDALIAQQLAGLDSPIPEHVIDLVSPIP